MITRFNSILPSFKLFALFSESLQNHKLKDLKAQLLKNASTYNPSTIIGLLYLLKNNENSDLLSSSEFQEVVPNIYGHIYSIDHKHLTLLLESMKKIEGFQRYNRNIPIFQLLVRKLNSIRGLSLSNDYIFRLLFALDDLRFPPMIILKYLNYLGNEEERF